MAQFDALATGVQMRTLLVQQAPALTPRAADERAAAYLSRLAQQDGAALITQGTLTATDTLGQPYPAQPLSATTTLALPRLSLGLAPPACADPGTAVPITVWVGNVGRAPAVQTTVTLQGPYGAALLVHLPELAPGAWTTATLTTTLALLPPRDRATEDEATYLVRLRAADGRLLPLQGQVTWQDGQGSAYGTVIQQGVLRQAVPILIMASPAPLSVPVGYLDLVMHVTNQGSGIARQPKLVVVHLIIWQSSIGACRSYPVRQLLLTNGASLTSGLRFPILEEETPPTKRKPHDHRRFYHRIVLSCG